MLSLQVLLHSHIKLKIYLFSILLILINVQRVNAYTVEEYMQPSGLKIYLVLSEIPEHNNFTRYLRFKNIKGKTKDVAVSFTKTTDLNYLGLVTINGLSTLQTLAERNNRSYWDKMYFVNKGGSTALEIESIKAEISYEGHDTINGREDISTIAYNINQSLDSGKDSFYLSLNSGRLQYAMDYLNITYSEFLALPKALRLFIYDIGKSGSSGTSDSFSSDNPKYSSKKDKALCSETVSWYYYTDNITLDINLGPFQIELDFKDFISHHDMHDAFLYSGRLYCYHSSREEWIKKDLDYNWDYDYTYTPQAGDYLNRKSNGDAGGHSMMMIFWDSDTHKALAIDGPYNINFLTVAVRSQEQRTDPDSQRDYCVGRIPVND